MRLVSLTVAAILLANPSSAGQAEPSSAGSQASSPEDGSQARLPVSVERIRETLSHFPEKPLLRGINEEPDFTVTVEQPLTLDMTLREFFKNTDFSGGPVPAGGLYGYEQQRIFGDPNGRPLSQPYAAFTQGELVQVAVTSTLSTLLGRYLTRGFENALQDYGEQAAAQEVRQAIADFCAARAGGGQGVSICSER